MGSLIQKLWHDQVGSSLSAEMALVTSVTVGALFMGMSQFSATVNREFEEAAVSTGLTIAELEDEKADEENPADSSDSGNVAED